MSPTSPRRATRPRTGQRRAFTLVELLVVIGIIALLISILLPALGRARKSARAVQCASNIRSILQGMQLYVAENKGYFPGSANSTAAHMINHANGSLLNPPFNDDNCPEISQIWDWQAPIARLLKIEFNNGPLIADRRERMTKLFEHPAFQCPDNETLSPVGSGPAADWPTTLAPSYFTAMIFHLLPRTGPSGTAAVTQCFTEWDNPTGYVPKITKVGDASRKIYIADGARYSNNSLAPTYNTSVRTTQGGSYADQGAFSRHTNSWYRGVATGNGKAGFDARLYGFRHGKSTPGGPGDQFRMNAGFFDGHVELLGDLQAANPSLWVPKGCTMEVTREPGQMFADAFELYSPIYGSGKGRPIFD